MMSKLTVAFAVFLALATGCASGPRGDAVRIDASSAEAAEASYQRMMASRSEAERQKLGLAILMLNMEGVKSAHEVEGNPELESPSIARVRNKVAGMTAEQIIERANKNPSVRVQMIRE